MEVVGDSHRVVILGGGFGGLYAARALRRAGVQVTLIDRRNFHLFQPLLYQVATGGLSPGDIAAPLRAVLRKQKNARVFLAEARDLDAEQRRVILDDAYVEYDTLVVSVGARNHYFGHDEWGEFAPGLKTIEDATEIRSRVLMAFEAAEREPDPEARRAWLTFVVVGGGPTGVELAGALGEIANDTLKDDFRSFRPEESSILLVEHDSRILPPYPEKLSVKAENALIRLSARCITGTRVTAIDGEGVELAGPAGTYRIRSRTVLWAAGVAASPFGEALARRAGAQLDRKGRVVVGPDLSIPDHPEIFVIGDLANARGGDGNPLPGVAPVAMQQGRYVGRAIIDRLAGRTVEPFRYRDKGNLATIGRAAAVADLGPLHFNGFAAWVTWLFVHLMYLVGFQNRVLVLVQWAFHYLTHNRGARLIGPPPAGPSPSVDGDATALRRQTPARA
ncbi:MAG: NAD(P)/FAD-dependent oxidoreductase [Bryobacteraceae bacterium]|nr:NAD(P)/FAD-dependent oxidoreductase [Bryobacteraceae bacterium]